MYTRVYAPNGEPFDVTRERADTCILNLGWTQTPPVQVEPAEVTSEEIIVEEITVEEVFIDVPDEPVEAEPVRTPKKRRKTSQD